MSLDDIIKIIQTLGFPVVVAIYFMRRDDKGINLLRQQNARMIRALALIAQALEAKEATLLLTKADNDPQLTED